MNYEKISGFADEIAADIATQFSVLNKLNIKYFEPRGVDGKNISTLSPQEVKALKAKMDENGIKVSSIGSPIGKIKISDSFDEHFEKFKNVVEVAKGLDAKYIRMFSFYPRENGAWSKDDENEVFARLTKMIDYAKQNDVILLHENEKDIYGDITCRVSKLMEKLYCDNFKAVFDPANFVQCNVDTKDAIDKLLPYIEYMHIKDANEDGRVVPAGYGIGNVEYILNKLFKTGFDGYLSLEPHLGSFKGLAELELDLDTSDMEEGGESTFTIAYNALVAILDKLNK